MKVRKKPVEHEARQLLVSNFRDVAKWCNGLLYHRADNFEPYIQLMSLEGPITARLNEYIIRYGDRYIVMTQKGFEEHYEIIEQ